MDLWGDFRDGSLENTEDARASTDGMAIGGAVCATVEVPAGQTREVAFSLVWDMPVVRDGAGKGYYRRYTRFYGRDGKAVSKLAAAALTEYPAWEKAIEAWQGPILSQTGLPDWFKAALFNELYFLASGGSVWTDGEAGQKASKATDIGHFAYLESLEYLYVNTYDVHFYASFALAMLWPELELSLQRDFARAINDEHLEIVEMLGSGDRSERKIAGSLPHDLGAWGEQPWDKVNAYQFQDVSRWKDLNSKFVLQVYRDVVATGDKKFAKEMWEPVKAAMEYMLQFDLDEDGMIENDGFPDQTYDVWVADGVSAYSGGLWMAALSAAAALADMLKEDAAAKQYRKMLASAQEAYDELLWTGEYYAYDTGRHRHQNSIMADQMAGQWYAKACGLPSIVPDDNARSALEKVYNYNVLMFEDGEMGAVNGMRPDGRVDTSCMQSQEVWTGTTYAVAAAMIQEGLMDEAWDTAKGVAHMTYTELGYWFQTPEAWNHEGDFRALGYMRPLAIWAMLWAWQRSAKPRTAAQQSKTSRSTSKASASPTKKPAAKKKAK
jgi:non-lysosomal glucosylceramidase